MTTQNGIVPKAKSVFDGCLVKLVFDQPLSINGKPNLLAVCIGVEQEVPPGSGYPEFFFIPEGLDPRGLGLEKLCEHCRHAF